MYCALTAWVCNPNNQDWSGLMLHKQQLRKCCRGCRDKTIFCGWVEVAVESGKTQSQEPVNSEASCLQKSLAWQKGNEGAEGLCASDWPSCWGGGAYVQVSRALTDILRAQRESLTLPCRRTHSQRGERADRERVRGMKPERGERSWEGLLHNNNRFFIRSPFPETLVWTQGLTPCII